MAKNQTRRTISVSRKLYEEASAYAERNKVPLSQLCETGLYLAMGRVDEKRVKLLFDFGCSLEDIARTMRISVEDVKAVVAP